VFLAQLKLARGDVTGAAAMLAEASRSARERNFVQRLPEVAAVQVLTLLRQGNLAAAAELAELHDLPISRARVHLARGDASAALAVLDPLCQQMEAKGWEDERLKVMVLQALVHQAQGDIPAALLTLEHALTLAEREGHVRLFVDEGPPMARLLKAAAKQGIAPGNVRHLLTAFGEAEGRTAVNPGLIEPLSDRELDVLRLLGTELNGPELARELMVSLNTLRSHTKNIYTKLGVNNRRAAVRRAEELALF
jgi:LuxR family maltose regulon positive regulatory protein